MKIGIDISQMAYKETGVGEYVGKLVNELLRIDPKNQYVLFFSSLRRKFLISNFPSARAQGEGKFLNKSQISNSNIKIRTFKFPPMLLDLLWNRFHILPVEWFIGNIDVFISSDWVQPPTNARKVTILYDLIVYKYPEETDRKIVSVQKRRLQWVKKECDSIICISESAKKDAISTLGIEEKRLKVIYPGI